MRRARCALRVVFAGLAVALCSLVSGTAQAAPESVCHTFAEARYQEALAGHLDNLQAQDTYESAFDDCERGFQYPKNEPLSDMALDLEAELISDPWESY